MTRLFNLESYVECFQYIHIFNESREQVIPDNGDLPTKYKSLIQKYANNFYLPEPINSVTLPQKLTINNENTNYAKIGSKLTQGDKQRLFIIRDTVDLMTLSTSNLLEQHDGYLYSSAYHYWNHYSQIAQYQVDKSLVFIDLDCFPCDRLIPINLSRTDNSSYLVPILNTQEPIIINDNNKILNSVDVYNKICQTISKRILIDNFNEIYQNIKTVNHLAHYLQKIAFFKEIKNYVKQDRFDLIIELLYGNKILYKKITLSRVALAEMILGELNIESLRTLANNNPQYQFILTSQYNIFANIRQLLPEFICLNPIHQEFNRVWKEKISENFPLFGIYLDRIEFAVGISDKRGRLSKQWIQLSNQENLISYEGKITNFIGNIPSLNQDFVRIRQGRDNAILPIRVNGNDYCRNDVPQDYKIQLENYQGTEDIRVRIEFNLKPGSFPELKVSDLRGKYKIKTSLIDRQQISYSYIPPDKIFATRSQKSLEQIKYLQESDKLPTFKSYLSQLNKELNKVDSSPNRQTNYQKLTNLLHKAYREIRISEINNTNNQRDLLLFIDSPNSDIIVSQIQTEIENIKFDKLVEMICDTINSTKYQKMNSSQNNLLADGIIFIGKLYKFSQYINLKNFFNLQFDLVNRITSYNIGNEYLQCLARVAVKEELQNHYFSYFDSLYKSENSRYLWGYGRILLWYYNFASTAISVEYQNHFIAIMEYLLSKPHQDFDGQYKQNAFLSLLYLLTFRDRDTDFCKPGTDEFSLAQKVIEHFQSDRIILKAVSEEKSLNQFFQEMLDGCATEDDIGNIVQA